MPRRSALCITSRCFNGHQHSPMRDFGDDDDDDDNDARPADDEELVANWFSV